MSISKIKREYRIKNLFSLLIIFVLLAAVSLISRSFKNNATPKSENLFPVARADMPTTPGGFGEGDGSCGGSDGGCGSSGSGGSGGACGGG